MGRRQTIFVTLLFAAGIGMFVGVGLIGRSDPPDEATRTPGVESLIPGRGDEVLQQQRVGIDLEPGFRLVSLTISPDATCGFPVEVITFTQRVDGLEQFFYQPDEGKPIVALAPDQNCVRATVEDIQRPGVFSEVEWVFTVN